MAVLNLAQLGKIVSLELDVDLAIVFLRLLNVFDFNVRDVVLLQINSYNLVPSGGGFHIALLLIG